MTAKSRPGRRLAVIVGSAALAIGATAYGVQTANAADAPAVVAFAQTDTSAETPQAAKPTVSVETRQDPERTPRSWRACMTAHGAPEYARVMDRIESKRDPLGARAAWIRLNGTPEFTKAQAACERELSEPSTDGGVG